MKNLDNPVPSLTKEEIDYIKENLLNNYIPSNKLYKSIIKKLNGVETNKEQPKCTCSESEAIYCNDGKLGKCQ